MGVFGARHDDNGNQWMELPVTKSMIERAAATVMMPLSTIGGAAQDGAYSRPARDLAFPGSLRPRRHPWSTGQEVF